MAGFEATIAEAPAVEPEPAAEVTIEKSQGVTEAPEPGVVSLEPLELEGTAAGVEPMAFEPPPAGETPTPAPDLAPMEFTPPGEGEVVPSAPPAQAFDDQLAWGTGQRRSGAISPADVEAAERTHEPSLEPLVQEPSTPQAAEVPPVEVEEPSAGGDLPLIFPDEVTPGAEAGAREAEARVGAEPEPVVTETMAELYAKQGLMAEARDIYRKLAAQRPGDAAVAGRLNELERVVAGPRVSGGARVLEAAGGPSARDFLAGVFGGTGPAPSAAPAEASTPLETAFSGASGATPEPTRRASDEVSLAAVFGEEPPPMRQPAAPPQAESRPAGQGFSFDEFFGGQRNSPAGEDQGGEDDDDFKRWLKGLKS
ncbi:MAG: hypothetical protein HYW06_07710 [Gemmatimonadetes bacterium]|nr:hypothetical protein [Gemmatimonadota bacterium]